MITAISILGVILLVLLGSAALALAIFAVSVVFSGPLEGNDFWKILIAIVAVPLSGALYGTAYFLIFKVIVG